MTDRSSVNAALAAQVAGRLLARRQTLAVSESSTGGLVSAALLTVPGASAFYLGGAIIYTAAAREAFYGLKKESLGGVRSATVAMAELLAETVRARLGADWGLGETGATGPSANPYGDPAGHGCLAVAGPRAATRLLATGVADRAANMTTFADAALTLLLETLEAAG